MTKRFISHRSAEWLYAWIKARISREQPTGLVLTIGMVVAALSLIGFVAIAEDVVFMESITHFDQRVLNYIPSIRNDLLTYIFRFFTTMASSKMLIFLLLVLGIASWRRQRSLFIILSTALVSVLVSSTILKIAVGRARPAQALSLVHESSFSFPSGHTLGATVMYGLLGYLLYRLTQSPLKRTLITLGTLATILLVGFSRMYLGAHFPSDVVGSFLFGGFLLSIFITAIEINERHHVRSDLLLQSSLFNPIIISLAAAFLASLLFASHVTPFYKMGYIITKQLIA